MTSDYLVIVKSDEQIQIDSCSFFKKVPYFIMKQNILKCFSAFELFKLRGINKEWNELVRSCWSRAFKREMKEQLIAADLTREIEINIKYIQMRNLFYHKIAVLLKTFSEIIDYEKIKLQIENNTIERVVIKILVYIISISNPDYQYLT